MIAQNHEWYLRKKNGKVGITSKVNDTWWQMKTKYQAEKMDEKKFANIYRSSISSLPLSGVIKTAKYLHEPFNAWQTQGRATKSVTGFFHLKTG